MNRLNPDKFQQAIEESIFLIREDELSGIKSVHSDHGAIELLLTEIEYLFDSKKAEFFRELKTVTKQNVSSMREDALAKLWNNFALREMFNEYLNLNWIPIVDTLWKSRLSKHHKHI